LYLSQRKLSRLVIFFYARKHLHMPWLWGFRQANSFGVSRSFVRLLQRSSSYFILSPLIHDNHGRCIHLLSIRSAPDRAAPRRSKRIQPPVPTVSKDPTRTASTNPSRRAVRSKPERNVASSLTARSSAKPQGISKKQPAQLTRGRARKK
jgi:hypothetical protein